MDIKGKNKCLKNYEIFLISFKEILHGIISETRSWSRISENRLKSKYWTENGVCYYYVLFIYE